MDVEKLTRHRREASLPASHPLGRLDYSLVAAESRERQRLWLPSLAAQTSRQKPLRKQALLSLSPGVSWHRCMDKDSAVNVDLWASGLFTTVITMSQEKWQIKWCGNTRLNAKLPHGILITVLTRSSSQTPLAFTLSCKPTPLKHV